MNNSGDVEQNRQPAIPPAAPAVAPAINTSIPFPEPLKLSGNMQENVENFRDAFDIYLVASGLEYREERVKIATFKAALGTDARKVFNLWPLREEEKTQWQHVWNPSQHTWYHKKT